MTRSWLKWLIYSGLSGLLLVLGYGLLATQAGLNLSIWLLRQTLPGTLQITAIEGRLLGPIRLQGLEYQQGPYQLAISKAYLAWKSIALFTQGRLVITRLELDTVMAKWPNHIKQIKQGKNPLSVFLTRTQLLAGHIKHMDLYYGHTHLHLQGSIAQHWQLQWQLKIPVLRDFVADTDGALSMTGLWQGNHNQSVLQLQLQQEKLSLYGWQIHTLQATLHAVLDLSLLKKLDKITLWADEKNADISQPGVDRQPHLGSHPISNRHKRGSCHRPILTWQATIKAHQVSNPQFALQSPQLELSGNLHPFYLQAQSAPFVFHYKKANHNGLKLAMPASQLEIKSTLAGLQANLIATKPKTADFSAMILLPQASKKSAPTSYKTKFLVKQLSPNLSRHAIYKQPRKAGCDNLSYQKLVACLTHISPAPYARAHLTLYHLDDLQPFVPLLTHLQGDLVLDVHLDDSSPTLPLQFDLRLQRAQAQLPDLGLTLRAIQANVQLKKQLMTWSGSVNSGEGKLQFKGATQLNVQSLPSVATVTGYNARIINNATYQINASPRITLNADRDRIKIDGDVWLPYARFRIDENGKTAITLTKDIVFIDEPPPISTELASTYSTLRLHLGDDVQLSYQGLQASLQGTLHLNEAPGQPTLAKGRIRLLKGHFQYYGQRLQLEKDSYLVFPGGAIANPEFNITVSKTMLINRMPNQPITPSVTLLPQSEPKSSTSQAVMTKLGAHIQGNALKPQISLFAEPADGIDQIDILSYLLTGLPSRQLTTANTQLLLNTVYNLSNKEGRLYTLVYNLQKKLSLDQLSIQAVPITDAQGTLQQHTSLVLGKMLAPRLYVSYSIGLLKPISLLKISYFLNHNWSIEGSNSNFSNGIDLRYQIEGK